MSAQDIGRRIAAFRKERGLTLEELGERVGLSQGQMSRLENGRQGLRSATLLRIAEALGVQPIQFFVSPGDEDEETVPVVSAPLRKALRDPPFASLVEDLAAAYRGAPSRFAAIKSVVSVLLESRFEEPLARNRSPASRNRRS